MTGYRRVSVRRKQLSALPTMIAPTSSSVLLSNLLTKEIFNRLFQRPQAEPQVAWSKLGLISR